MQQARAGSIKDGGVQGRRASAISARDLARRLYRVEEAAGYMRVSVSKMRQLGWSGEIPYIQERPGTLMFFDRADLDRWIDAHRKAA